MAHIERRQAHIRRIRQKLAKASREAEHIPHDPTADYHIGTSEKHPLNIGSFLRSHSGDPAINVGFTECSRDASRFNVQTIRTSARNSRLICCRASRRSWMRRERLKLTWVPLSRQRSSSATISNSLAYISRVTACTATTSYG
jgi:hypothetical protein